MARDAAKPRSPVVSRACLGVRRILVIRLGALGDFVQAMAPRGDPRASPRRRDHAADHRALRRAGAARALFRRGLVDARPAWWDLAAPDCGSRAGCAASTSSTICRPRPARAAISALAGRPRLVGHRRGASHPHANPARDFMHTLERQREQLAHGRHRRGAAARSLLADRPASFELPDRDRAAGARAAPASAGKALARRALRRARPACSPGAA